MIPKPFGVPTTPPRIVPSANLLMVQSASLSRSVAKKIRHFNGEGFYLLEVKFIFSFKHFVYEYPVCKK